VIENKADLGLYNDATAINVCSFRQIRLMY